MFDEDFRYEPELRTKIGAIWLGALYDCLDAEIRGYIDSLEAEATANGYKNMAIFCQRAREFNEIVTEVLAMYSKEEQLAIQDLRDQLVHSWLHKKFRDSFSVKYVKGNKLLSEVISRDAYFDLIRPLAEKGPDDEMKPILKQFLNKDLRYWKAIALFQTPNYLRDASIAIFADIGVEYPYDPRKQH